MTYSYNFSKSNLIKETAKAIQFSASVYKDSSCKKYRSWEIKMWAPKSQSRFFEDGSFEVKTWILEKKENELIEKGYSVHMIAP